jgi:beta-1,4-mannosyl-glycoprotein beta-1,4-N-acetylglucosaminyltransferase
MIYDTFTFFKELDLLEIRLHELSDVVDKFVLVEADRTQSNQPKPFYYEENKERFKDYWDKIIAIQVHGTERFWNPGNQWCIDNATRDMVLTEVQYAPDDMVIIDDSDTIPKASVIRDHVYAGPVRLAMWESYYYLNCLHYNGTAGWSASQLWKYKDIPDKASQIRAFRPGLVDAIVPDAGWHFSYIGGIEAIQQKVRAGSHFRECGLPELMDEGHLAQVMMDGTDLFNRPNYSVVTVPLDERFPKYLLDNKDKFKQYIKEVQN